MSSVATVPAGSLARDIRVMTLVGVAHGFSHFYQLVLPPLFFLMKDEFVVSYTQLGLLMTVFYTASGLSQTAAGFVVDRYGAGRILLGGLGLFAGCIAIAGLVPTFWLLMPLVVLAAIGNSVFHPADFAILNGNIAPSRLGRAFGMHGICGNLGWAVASAASLALGFAFGWRVALLALGGLGLVVTLLLATQARYLTAQPGAQPATRKTESLTEGIRALFGTAILMCFAYFVLIAMALIGVQNWGADILERIYGTPHEFAAMAVTLFLFGTAAGVIAGGWLADHTTQHAWVAGSGMAAGAVLILLVATALPSPTVMLVLIALTGVALGCTNPSRDMLVRNATPPGSTGKVFGFVYSGLDLGSSVAPLLIGWMLDHGQAKLVLIITAAVMLLTIATIVGVRAQANPQRTAVPAE
jgi:MFS transporter, FSR family, fosmidomycin resistance protein